MASTASLSYAMICPSSLRCQSVTGLHSFPNSTQSLFGLKPQKSCHLTMVAYKLKKYIDDVKDPGPSGKPYSAKYIRNLVGDFYQTLLYGGIYGYLRNKKSKNGKLRLLYECAPMSFIVEQAGGKGSAGVWI
ncbi:hypothetical protein F3Y22_tig00024296pilonHSYRG00004 [Hibiscus syriacus]|uniref:D-fructose-1,6-bisphosphate 1-phosphohydrolase n=1 Tax=Hibiscus syriacus TaxID=106335 RepID=A0A6A3BTI0_HIBSY|nr:fructose-1,6-bisphosphatase, chloroplastic-like [Hibiscus syriacus]KAE8720210.1 hypothetical protein F3Y22_tig00024296pilonHSYRG00004 [Hibiscus syriacus]